MLVSEGNNFQPIWSRDGRFITYWSMPGAISADEGDSPAWIDGGRFLYLSASRMMVVEVQTHPDLRVGQPRPLNERREVRGRLLPSPDGRQFLTLSQRSMEGPIELRIILNWFQELERLAPHPHH